MVLAIMFPRQEYLWIFRLGYLKDCAYHTSLHTVQELQVKMKLSIKRSAMTWVTTLWFIYSKLIEFQNSKLNMCSQEDHMHTDSIQKPAFVQV
jgi:hypothetical protein